MNHNDVFQRATNSYRRRCTYPAIFQQPSAPASGFGSVNGKEVFVLRNESGILAAFHILATGRIGKPVDFPEESQFPSL